MAGRDRPEPTKERWNVMQSNVLLDDAPEDIQQLARDWPLWQRFSLPPAPVIVIVGAYQGKAMDFMGRLFRDYNRIVGFEPQEWAYMAARERLDRRRQMWLMNAGLGPEHIDNAQMGEWHTDAASFVNTGPGTREQGTGTIAEADTALRAMNLSHIDLMIMNIEGGEYTLLPHLRETHWLERIDRLAVQWHLNLPGVPRDAMESELERLGERYELEYDNRPTWTYHVKVTA